MQSIADGAGSLVEDQGLDKTAQEKHTIYNISVIQEDIEAGQALFGYARSLGEHVTSLYIRTKKLWHAN